MLPLPAPFWFREGHNTLNNCLISKCHLAAAAGFSNKVTHSNLHIQIHLMLDVAINLGYVFSRLNATVDVSSCNPWPPASTHASVNNTHCGLQLSTPQDATSYIYKNGTART